MKKKFFLLILDKIPTVLPERDNGVAWDVLGLGLTREELENGLSSCMQNRKDLTFLNSQPYAKQAAASVRKFFVPILDGLPERKISKGKTFGSLLREKNGENLWPFLAISEKSPIRCGIINELFYLALVKKQMQIKKYKKVKWEVKNKLLIQTASQIPLVPKGLECIKIQKFFLLVSESIYWVHVIKAFIDVTSIKLLTFFFLSKNSFAVKKPVIFTIFPYWWNNSKSFFATDRFFPTKPKNIFPVSPVYWAWWSASIKETLKWGKKWKFILARKKIHILQQYVPLKALFFLFSFKTFLKLLKARRKIRNLKLPLFKGFKVNFLLEREFSRSIGAGDLVNNKLILSACRQLAVSSQPSQLYFRFEGQPLDQALIQAAKGICPSVGYWHSAFAAGPNYLPLLIKNEKTAKAISLKRMPDQIISAQGVCKKSLLKAGFPEKSIRICGPIRSFRAIKNISKIKINKIKNLVLKHKSKSKKTISLFVAASVDPYENKALIFALNKSMKNLPPCILIIRKHPALKIYHPYFSLLTKNKKIKKIIYATDSNFYRKLHSSDVLITGGSTLPFEAAALGVPTIVFQSSVNYPGGSMEKFKNGLFIVNSSEQLTKKVNICINKLSEYKKKKKNWKSMLTKVFGNNYLNKAIKK